MLLVFDLDKTIVTDDYRLPKTIQEAIARAKLAGHVIAVLTGRGKAAALPYLDQLRLQGPYGVNNGALVIGSQGEILKRIRIPAIDVQQLVRFAELRKIEYCCMLDDILYVGNPDYEELQNEWIWTHDENRQVITLDPKISIEADKLIFGGVAASEQLGKEAAMRYPEYVVYEWSEEYVEVTGSKADKGSALELISCHLGFEQRDVIAFGDGVNDLTMLAWANHGIAVGPDADTKLVDLADEWIAAPEHNGVADWLELNLLN
ncbi:MAG: Cof-type HAD-IIB family hydrolase [Deinococcales bacterium]|nr:Cof-type HAD-IIB family hydrolase [Deinococcales bacterium]